MEFILKVLLYVHLNLLKFIIIGGKIKDLYNIRDNNKYDFVSVKVILDQGLLVWSLECLQ